MMLQPFISMDSLAISMLTDAQRQQLTDLAASYPKVSERLVNKKYADPERTALIPSQLMKLYISIL